MSSELSSSSSEVHTKYDFTQHEYDHYNKYEHVYGVILWNQNEDGLKFMTPNHMFPFTHRNDNETPEDAVIRAVSDAIGRTLDLSIVQKNNTLKFTVQTSWTDEEFAKNLEYYIEERLRPIWNSAGTRTQKYTYFLINVDEQFGNENHWHTGFQLREMFTDTLTAIVVEQLANSFEFDESEDEDEPSDDNEHNREVQIQSFNETNHKPQTQESNLLTDILYIVVVPIVVAGLVAYVTTFNQ